MLHDFFEECRHLVLTTEKNGLGGVEKTYRPGAVFSAGIYSTGSAEKQAAGQPGAGSTWTVVTDLDTSLSYGDMIQRIRDGLTLRVTSSAVDMETPAVAQVQYHIVTASKERRLV